MQFGRNNVPLNVMEIFLIGWLIIALLILLALYLLSRSNKTIGKGPLPAKPVGKKKSSKRKRSS